MSFFVAGAILVTGGYAAYSGAKNAKKARRQTELTTKRNEARIAEEKKEEERKKKQTAMRMQKRRGAAKSGAAKTRSTIKTGALGVTGSQSGSGGKRLTGE